MPNLLLSWALLFSSFVYAAACATIIVTSTPTGALKCYGNFISNGMKCMPCMNGEIALNNKCVRLALPGYGSNLNIVENFNTFLPNCLRLSVQNNTNCAECRRGFDVIAGRCVPQSCRMYSQVLNQCLDNLKETQLQLAMIQNTSTSPSQKKPQEIYIIGGPMSKMDVIASDNAIALGLPTFALVYSAKQLQKTDIFTGIHHTKSKQQPITITVGCSIYNEKQCTKCYEGYLLNLLSSQCVFISPWIPLIPNQPSPNQP